MCTYFNVYSVCLLNCTIINLYELCIMCNKEKNICHFVWHVQRYLINYKRLCTTYNVMRQKFTYNFNIANAVDVFLWKVFFVFT